MRLDSVLKKLVVSGGKGRNCLYKVRINSERVIVEESSILIAMIEVLLSLSWSVHSILYLCLTVVVKAIIILMVSLIFLFHLSLAYAVIGLLSWEAFTIPNVCPHHLLSGQIHDGLHGLPQSHHESLLCGQLSLHAHLPVNQL